MTVASNVGAYQENKPQITRPEIDQIDHELR